MDENIPQLKLEGYTTAYYEVAKIYKKLFVIYLLWHYLSDIKHYFSPAILPELSFSYLSFVWSWKSQSSNAHTCSYFSDWLSKTEIMLFL